jgi:phage gp29-like protein
METEQTVFAPEPSAFVPPLHRDSHRRQREFYNPLRGLDLERAVRLLEEAERGRTADLQWLYRMVEKRDSTVKGLKLRRLTALQKLDWDIKIPSRLPRGMTPAMAQAQADSLRAMYDEIENLPAAIEHMALATFRGYAHLEKHYYANNPALPVIWLEPVEQWFMVRHPRTWEWVYDGSGQGNYSSGTLISPRHFVTRELDDPVNEIALIAYLRKNLSQKDWDAFVEDFGIPSIFGVLSQNTPPDQVKAWLEIMNKVTGNSRGALPPGSDIKSVALGSQGDVPFKAHKEEQREEVVLAGTGGLLSMLTAATGLNSEQAKVHEAAFDAIAAAEGLVISAIFQAQLDKPHLHREFPGQKQAAYFSLAAVEEESLDALGDLLTKLATAGLEADENQISEKTGLKLRRRVLPPATGYPVPGASPFANREPGALDRIREERFLVQSAARLTAAEQQTLAPLIERVVQLLELEDDAAFTAALDRLREDLPELEKQVLGDEASRPLESAFEDILATAFANGVSARGDASPKTAPETAREGGDGA